MNKDEILKQAKKLYISGSKNREARAFSGEVMLSEYLVNSFHIGDYFFFIYYFPQQEMEFCSESIQKVLNIDQADFSLEYVIENMHPEDLENFMQFENTLLTFLPTIPADQLINYKSCYDYRLKDAHGNYKRILHQVRTLQNEEDGALIRTFGVFTDITHFKSDTHMQLDLIGLNGAPSFYDVKPDGSYTPGESPLSERETQILKDLAAGLNSVEIAAKLGISKYTVNNHRSSILQKTNSQNSMEALKVALRAHWI